jgi:glycosyltransferase involved in cell wall biosynthesis
LDGAVVFTGPASPDELKSYYLLSHLFAIASEHEGFCVPIVEAMALKVPVLAYASSAIPDTLGDGGMLLDERSPQLMAATMHRLISDEDLSFNFAVKGRQRYLEQFTNEKIETALFDAFDQLRSE